MRRVPWSGWFGGWLIEEREIMNFQTWAKWVAEIDAMTGGAIVELRPGPHGGMKIGVRWMIGKEQYGYEHAMSLGEMERMVEAAQPCVLEQITHAARRMTPNGGGQRSGD